MTLKRHAGVVANALLAAMFWAETAIAQEQGGILKIHHRDSPPSLSILEEVTISTVLGSSRLSRLSTTLQTSLARITRSALIF